MKKIISTIIAALLCVSVVIVQVAANELITVIKYDGMFVDVTESDWYYEDVKYVELNGLMNGTSETEFSPAGVTTRGMIVTILWRLEGKPDEEGKAFEDVKEDAYYHKAVSWASNNQIVSGYSQTMFGPDDIATREQLATIIYRYASYKKCDLAKKAELDKYEDKELISDYAVESIKWANANGIISGTSEITISPKDNVLRSQVAAILRRFCENFKSFGKDIENESEETANEKDKAVNNNVSGGSKSDNKVIDDSPINDSAEPEQDGETIENVESKMAKIEVNTAYGKVGESIAVVVDLVGNPGILGAIFSLEYDENVMTLVDAENGDAVSGVLTLTHSKELKSGTKFVWDGLELAPDDIKEGTMLILHFELSADAMLGKRYPLKLICKPGNVIDADLNEVNLEILQGFIEIEE